MSLQVAVLLNKVVRILLSGRAPFQNHTVIHYKVVVVRKKLKFWMLRDLLRCLNKEMVMRIT
jgi:hypothetical protein